jgi:hypothetical protein
VIGFSRTGVFRLGNVKASEECEVASNAFSEYQILIHICRLAFLLHFNTRQTPK